MLKLPERFKFDVVDSGYNFTSLYPVIIFGFGSGSDLGYEDDDLNEGRKVAGYSGISIKSFNTTSDPIATWKIKDCDLTVSSIRESIDINSRNFKTSNVNISFINANFGDDGSSFTDNLRDEDVINRSMYIYYTSDGYTIKGIYNPLSVDKPNEALLVYKGRIKKIDHDVNRVSIVLEDQTLEKLDKKVPIANTSLYSNLVYSKGDESIPIPMVYGRVDKAPALVLSDNSDPNAIVKDFIVPDDTLNDNRDIEMWGFGGGDTDINDGTSTGSRPLYVHKGDYFNVLQDFNNNVIGEVDNIDDWQWTNTEQYNLASSWIEIPKYFQGAFPLSPLAFNEMQCIKLRNPISLTSMWNPPIGYTADTGEHLVYNVYANIINPQLGSDSNDFPNDPYIPPLSIDLDPYTTYAQLPDPNSSELEIVGDYAVIPWFMPHREAQWNHGVWNDSTNGEFRPGSYQYEVQSWLTRNMNMLNSGINLAEGDEPNVVYIEMPTAQMIYDAAKAKIKEYGTSLGYNTSGWSVFENSGSQMRINSFVNICPAHIQRWGSEAIQTVDGSTAANYWYGTTDIAGNTDSEPLGFLGARDSAGNPYPYESTEMIAMNEGTGWATNPDFESVKYPQATFYRITLHQNHRRPESDGSGQGLGASFVCVSQLTDAMGSSFGSGGYCETTGDDGTYPTGGGDGTPQENAFYFNIFDDGSGVDFLFDPDDFAQYIPIDLVFKGHAGQYERMCRIVYRVAWNGVGVGDGITAQSNIGYGGRYFGAWHRNQDFEMLEDEMYNNSNGSWAIWVKNNIEGVGGSLGQLNDDPADNPFVDDFHPEVTIPRNHALSIPKGTIIPCKHRAQKEFGNPNTVVTGDVFVIGNTQAIDPDNIILHDGHPDFYSDDEGVVVTPILDQRLNLAFPLREIKADDEIKTDSFFQGKFEINFDTAETSDISTASFVASIGAVDTKESEEDEEGEFDWQTLDQKRNTLVSKTLDDCQSDGYVMFSTNPGDIGLADNVFSGGEEALYNLRIPQFHTTDNYNALNLTFRVDNDTASAEMDQEVAVLNANIHNASILHYTQFEKALESDFYISIYGRMSLDTAWIYNEQFPDGIEILKYSGELAYLNLAASSHITNPTDVIFHILEKEVGIIDNVDYNNIEKAREQLIPKSQHDAISFSLKEQMGAKNLFQDISRSSNTIPKFNNSSKFGFVTLKKTYGEEDVDKTIESNDVISYRFSRTPLSEINTLVNVKYRYDYAEDTYALETGYIDGYDCFGNGDSYGNQNIGLVSSYTNLFSYTYLGLDREDRILEFESKYIRSRTEAAELRDFLFLWHCNQHTRFNLKLPLKYCMLEVGDIINFNSLIDGTKAYGEDYTSSDVNRNGQIIYPFFLIESVSKTAKDIQIKAIQLHELQKTFNSAMGSVTRSFPDNIPEVADLTLYFNEDYEALDDFLLGNDRYFTSEQKRISDLNDDDYINQSDLEELEILIGSQSGGDGSGDVFGDVTGDDIVNVLDIIATVNFILGASGGDPVDFDINEDGVINVVDIVFLVNTILG